MDIKELNVNMQQATTNNHPWEFARARVIGRLIRNQFKNKHDNIKAVDIGCGDIFFLNQFCKDYPNCHPIAVDTAFNEEIIRDLSQKYTDINVTFFNHVDKVTMNGQKANLVFLMDVIEHIEHDVDFLKELSQKEFISDDTLFVITVPAYNSLYCSHDKWLGHYRRYESKMLEEHATAAGLSIVEKGYFFTTLLLPRWVQKKMESLSPPPEKKMENEVTGIGGWTGGKLISTLYEWCLLCDFYFFRFFRVFGIKFPGLSTYALCKRQS